MTLLLGKAHGRDRYRAGTGDRPGRLLGAGSERSSDPEAMHVGLPAVISAAWLTLKEGSDDGLDLLELVVPQRVAKVGPGCFWQLKGQ